jgi:hypothetical protein
MKLREIFCINGSDSKITFNSFGGAKEREFHEELESIALFKIKNTWGSTKGTQ